MATYKGYTLNAGATWQRYTAAQKISDNPETYKLDVGDVDYPAFTIGNAIIDEQNKPIDDNIKWVEVALTKKSEPVVTVWDDAAVWDDTKIWDDNAGAAN